MGAVTRQRGALASRQFDTDRADWRDHAACRGEDTELFYPPVGHATAPAAVQICRRCPVTAQCLAFAEQTGDDWAVLGGTTPKQRRADRRSRIHQRTCRWCRVPFFTTQAQYCGKTCRDQATHASRSRNAPRRWGRTPQEATA